MAVDDSRPILVTLLPSHYCEKARWALERYGIAYTEEAHAPGFHSGAVKKYGSSKSTTPCLFVPCSASPQQAQCTVEESTDILKWVDQHVQGATSPEGARVPALFPVEKEAEVTRLCALFDSRLGPAARQWAYSYKLHEPYTSEMLTNPPVPVWERVVVRWAAWPVIRSVMAKGMDISPETGKTALAEARSVLEEVALLLADGRKYLTGDTLTAADISFACLGAPLVAQPYATHKGLNESTPPEMRAIVEELRGTPAGQLLLRLWVEDRGDVVAKTRKTETSNSES